MEHVGWLCTFFYLIFLKRGIYTLFNCFFNKIFSSSSNLDKFLYCKPRWMFPQSMIMLTWKVFSHIIEHPPVEMWISYSALDLFIDLRFIWKTYSLYSSYVVQQCAASMPMSAKISEGLLLIFMDISLSE